MKRIQEILVTFLAGEIASARYEIGGEWRNCGVNAQAQTDLNRVAVSMSMETSGGGRVTGIELLDRDGEVLRKRTVNLQISAAGGFLGYKIYIHIDVEEGGAPAFTHPIFEIDVETMCLMMREADSESSSGFAINDEGELEVDT